MFTWLLGMRHFHFYEHQFTCSLANITYRPVAGALGRHPHGGRNWEGFSPDPYLTGVAMEATVNGFHHSGVQTCSKHYIGNEQETQRNNSTLPNGNKVNAISANIDDRTLHELYLWPFAQAVKAGTTSIMCAYSRYNGTYSCENSPLLNNILKQELGFRGYVVSDWFATHSAGKAATAGLDLEMPGVGVVYDGASNWFGPFLQKDHENGSFALERLDDMVKRIMTAYYLIGQDSSDFPTLDASMPIVLGITTFGLAGAKELFRSSGMNWTEPTPRDARKDHAAVIRQMGSAGTVLLKNMDKTLPLQAPSNIGVFGAAGADLVNGLMYWQAAIAPEFGPVVIGGGSGSARYSHIVPPLEAIKRKASETGARVQYITNNTAIALGELAVYPTPQVCIAFLSSFAAEGWDRSTLLADNNSTDVVEQVTSICENTVVVVFGPGVVTMPWADNPRVKAILAAHYPGEEVGNSIVDILWGAEEPSGRLPYTIPMNETDLLIPIVTKPEGPGPDDWQADFTERQLIDYRAFDEFKVAPRYEFGFGLSYTGFDLVSMKTKKVMRSPSATADSSRAVEPGGNPDLWTKIVELEATVHNVGNSTGHAVPQLYVSFPDSTPEGTPVRVLRGFNKVRVEPDKQHQVVFGLTRRDLSYWDSVNQEWVIPKGSFKFSTGFSSRDLRVHLELDVLGACS